MRLNLIVLLFGSAAAASPDAAALAAKGRCAEALPLLRKLTQPDRRAALAGVRCAMALNQPGEAVQFLEELRRAFPSDPEVLYLSVRVYSDLSLRASRELLTTAPGSAEVHELNAEALETQGKWDEALQEYRAALERSPDMRGIHYRIGRLLLSQPKAGDTFDEAKREFEAELRIDPSNAGAEYVLGEMARQQAQLAAALDHFGKAASLDHGFADAYLGLGRALLEAGRAADAVTPLTTATRLDPRNPTTHYYAAIALRRSGRKTDSDRENALFQQATAEAQQARDAVRLGLTRR